MITFIEILGGLHEGSRYKVIPGQTIGREKADILVRDPKVSSTHAQFSLDGKGQLVLLDMDSSNGLHINGRRVKKVALLSGVIFEVGRTQFKVVNVQEEQAPEFSRIVTWRTVLKEKLALDPSSEDPFNSALKSFRRPLKLTFIQGIQTDQEIIIGYGPRSAGADSLDIELLDEGAPKAAFEVSPGPGDTAKIKILSPGQVTLNNQSLDAETLKDGDVISFGETQIKVSYL